MSMEKSLKEQYEMLVDKYLQAFCKKHEFDYEDAKFSWVGDDRGGICMIADYFISFDCMRIDIDSNAKKGQFESWYDYNLMAEDLGITSPNYANWVAGCPRIPQKEMEKLSWRKTKIDNLRTDLEEDIKQYSCFHEEARNKPF